ncbi:hypothetical protein G9A89_019468 [Geosiphon pyriformis]|nr:hypothetical protein G9A89_019468 [Geosiphon pyriformis]
MGNYSYLSQQLEEYFKAHNKNDLDFIELNLLPSCLICFLIEKQSSRQFQDFWNWFLNKHSAETYTPPDFEYLNYQIHIWIAAHQSTETLLETEEESYQTAPVFNLFSSKSKHSTQTVTSEPMAQDPLQQNILIALQGIQTALGQRNNTLLPLFRSNTHNPIEWLDDFERAATANQYNDKYKFQIVGGYLQGFPATWFSQETDANVHQRIIKWMPTNVGENNTSFTTWFENNEIVTEYAKAIRKLIKCVDSEKNWTEEQKIYSFTKGLRTDLSYTLWPLLALKDNPTMDMAIELAQQIEDNQRIHLGSTLPVFASVSAPQMAAASFAAQLKIQMNN